MEELKKQIESRIAEKVGADPGFRKVLFNNPRTAIEGTLGIAIPSGVEVTVREEGAGRISLTIAAQSKGTEISDDLLEQVAGGNVGPPPI